MSLKTVRIRTLLTALALGSTLLGSTLPTLGCKKLRKTTSAPKSEAFADRLKPIVEAHKVQVMHFPDFADYAPLVQKFYDDRNYEVAWVDNGEPTAQAKAFISAFTHADEKGLNPADFDAGQWDSRIAGMKGNDDNVAQFDAAITVSVMRYISDLRIGRVNPTHFNFDIDTQNKKYDLPEFVSDNAVDASDVPKLIASVEPDNEQYRQSEQALSKYLALAKQQQQSGAQPLPLVAKPLAVGGDYPATAELLARLQLEGDLPGAEQPQVTEAIPVKAAQTPTTQTGALKGKLQQALKVGEKKVGLKTASPAKKTKAPEQTPATTQPAHPEALQPMSPAYTQQLADGVSHYEARHGFTVDGKLTPQVITSLNIPMSARVLQLSDSLERWRWLPNEYVNAPLMVNLPEFMLRGFDSDQPGHKQDFAMKVVVGKVVGEHQTPVFTHEMKYVIFRPFWNLPQSIVKKEIMSHVSKSGMGYLAAHRFETVDSKGSEVHATPAELERGSVLVREKPGPKNSLGLIKFMFPNEYDIYLHSTPAPELFARTRRDFSHGCVRVEHPDDLAVWVLRNTPGDWTIDKVHEAFADEKQNNHTVVLKQQIPIVIFYQTARVGDDGQVDFFDDIYGYDQQLNDVLAKGLPYPAQQTKVNPNAVSTPGDTQ